MDMDLTSLINIFYMEVIIHFNMFNNTIMKSHIFSNHCNLVNHIFINPIMMNVSKFNHPFNNIKCHNINNLCRLTWILLINFREPSLKDFVRQMNVNKMKHSIEAIG